jgi:CMP-N,N'-diacetyllegionaminic acid synthase
MRTLAIIPARGGSKGIPRKNIADVCGLPLIAYSIRTGQELLAAGAVARCVVSTDDEEIASVARAHGADVPFLRPAYAATDQAKAISYVEHMLDALEASDESYDAVLLLQPTSPLRDSAEIVSALLRFAPSAAMSLIACYREDYISDMVMYDLQPDGLLAPRNSLHNKGVRRQDLKPAMVRNGALYVTKVPYLRSEGRLVCDRPALLEMTKFCSIDVDTPDDLRLLRAVVASCK